MRRARWYTNFGAQWHATASTPFFSDRPESRRETVKKRGIAPPHRAVTAVGIAICGAPIFGNRKFFASADGRRPCLGELFVLVSSARQERERERGIEIELV